MKVNIHNLSHYADILAIPFFALLSIYFYNLEKKNNIGEYTLFI